jgi:drug/metabolite transporter (DMT)-like permease
MLKMSQAGKTEGFLSAYLMLVLATAFWGVSFPVTKALSIEEHRLSPDVSYLIISGAALFVRFSLAALFALFLCLKTFRSITKREVMHGFVIGAFVGIGAIFQTHGINYTSASISAFLTAFYAILVPVFESVLNRKPPSPRIWISSIIVITGMGILSGISIGEIKIGRGEWETLISSLFFSFQILWMGRIDPEKDKSIHISLFMFITIALLQLFPLALFSNDIHSVIATHLSIRALLLQIILALVPALGAFLIMNRFQPRVSASAAGVIYCFEPVFALILATFLPEILLGNSRLYANESITYSVLIGGSLIIAANLLIQEKRSGPAEKTVEVSNPG